MSIRQIISSLKKVVHRVGPLVLAAVLLVGIPASSVAYAIPTPITGDIAGTVTDQNGTGVAGIKVNAYASMNDYQNANQASWTLTNTDGTYDISSLSAGSYIVSFNGASGTNDSAGKYYIEQLYNNKTTNGNGTPDLVTVAAGTTTANINATLAPAGAVSGVVIDQHGTGVPAGLKITAFASLNDYNNGNQAGMTFTNSDGSYTLGGLPAGSGYIVDFNVDNSTDPYHVEQFYYNKSTSDTADPVTITDDTTFTINPVLPTYGHITGTVMDTTGAPASAAEVTAYASAADYNNGKPTAGAAVNADGTYDLYGLPSGTYLLYFANRPMPNYPVYVPQFYNGVSTIVAASPVAVTKGITTAAVNATLALMSSNGRATAHGKMLPVYGTDILPGLTQANQTDTASAALIVLRKSTDLSPVGRLTFTYDTGSHCNNPKKAINCHTMKVVSTALGWISIHGVNNGTNNPFATIQGVANVTIDGTTTVNPFRITVGNGQTSGRFEIGVYAPGTNPNDPSVQPIYHMNEPLVRGRVVVKS